MHSEDWFLLISVAFLAGCCLVAVLMRRAEERRARDEAAQALYEQRLARYKVEPPEQELPDVFTRTMVKHHVHGELDRWQDPQGGVYYQHGRRN